MKKEKDQKKEKKTRAIVKTPKLKKFRFDKAFRAFQRECRKDRPLEKYIAEWSKKRKKRVNGPRLFVLVVNEIIGGGTLTCEVCGTRMQGNGRSIKYVVDYLPINPRQTAEVVYVILCPQECCLHCKAAGLQYCHKIIPDNTAYGLGLFSKDYEKAALGDLDGTCPLSEAGMIRHARRVGVMVLELLARPPEAIAAAARAVRESRGFDAITAAVRVLVRTIWGSVPPTGWYSGLVNRCHLRARTV